MTGEHLSPDIRELLRLLHEHRVRYLVVGGEAVIHYGYSRLTGDIDLFYDASAGNARRLHHALREFWGGAVPSVDTPEELCEAGVIVQFGRPPNRIDLLGALPGVRFATAWRRRSVESLTSAGRKAHPVNFIGLADLLANKRKVGRHKDLDDVEHLEQLADPGKRRRRSAERPRRG